MYGAQIKLTLTLLNYPTKFLKYQIQWRCVTLTVTVKLQRNTQKTQMVHQMQTLH